MPIIGGIIILVIYFFFCHKVAQKAEKDGRSYFLWFIISALFDPALAFVVMLILS